VLAPFYYSTLKYITTAPLQTLLVTIYNSAYLALQNLQHAAFVFEQAALNNHAS
jgi:hypothetical protein